MPSTRDNPASGGLTYIKALFLACCYFCIIGQRMGQLRHTEPRMHEPDFVVARREARISPALVVGFFVVIADFSTIQPHPIPTTGSSLEYHLPCDMARDTHVVALWSLRLM